MGLAAAIAESGGIEASIAGGDDQFVVTQIVRAGTAPAGEGNLGGWNRASEAFASVGRAHDFNDLTVQLGDRGVDVDALSEEIAEGIFGAVSAALSTACIDATDPAGAVGFAAVDDDARSRAAAQRSGGAQATGLAADGVWTALDPIAVGLAVAFSVGAGPIFGACTTAPSAAVVPALASTAVWGAVWDQTQ